MQLKPIKNEVLLAEIEDILRVAPPRMDFEQYDEDTLPWIGRAVAAIERWDHTASPACLGATQDLQSLDMGRPVRGFYTLITLLHQARSDLLMDVAPLSVAIPHRQVYDYFEEVRQLIELATTDLFFVDPYLDPDFVGRYLPLVKTGVVVRLLGREKIQALVSAVDMFVQQSGAQIQVRAAKGLHDRYFFIDERSCYQSGASFKDGARTAPTTITQITDAFDAMWKTYDQLWQQAGVHR